MKKLLLLIFAAVAFATSALAQHTPAQLIAEINANFPDNTTGFITPALARTTLIDMVNSMATTINSPTPAGALGAKCDGVTDDTGAFNSANTAMPRGGAIRIPDGANCIVVGKVSFALDGLYLVGGGVSGRDSAGSTITCTTATTADCITWTGFTGGGAVNLRVDASARTGVACTFRVTGSARILFQHLTTIDNNSFCLTSTNTIIIDDVESTGPTSGSGKAWINWIGTLAARSDVVIVQNSGYQENNNGADCILWDGLANTMTLTSVRCLNVVNGIHTTNVNGNSNNFPAFLQAYDLEVDGGTGPAIRIDAGGWFRCIHCDLFHSTNDVAVIINDDNPGTYNTIVRAVQFFGGRIGNSGKQCVTSGAQSVRFIGVSFGSCSLNGAGLFPAVEFTAKAVDSQIIGGEVVDFGDGNLASPGVQLDAGASLIAVMGIDLHYPAVPFLDNSTGQNNLWLPFIGQQSFLGFGKAAAADQVVYAFRPRSGLPTTVRVENPLTATSTTARFEMATGSASAFSDLGLTDGTTPAVSLTTGSGVTGGISLDASAATGANVSLKSAAGVPIIITSSVPMLQTQAVTMASLPTCTAGLAGSRAMVSNGTGTPPATFDTAITIGTPGTVFAPVFCNGSAWIYG